MAERTWAEKVENLLNDKYITAPSMVLLRQAYEVLKEMDENHGWVHTSECIYDQGVCEMRTKLFGRPNLEDHNVCMNCLNPRERHADCTGWMDVYSERVPHRCKCAELGHFEHPKDDPDWPKRARTFGVVVCSLFVLTPWLYAITLAEITSTTVKFYDIRHPEYDRWFRYYGQEFIQWPNS